ncbi:hypothetical protein ACLI1A_10240 [Flavobacterium sp. RHBU_3]|uniref:hypothetical protein n=1 Tax=Flavobacterium sp. RHBU_3 TaxID=3391184 RepID=UPI003984EC15
MDTYNSKIIPDRGKIFIGAQPLVLKGVGSKFPFTTSNNSSLPYAVNAMNFRFSVPDTITIDYGDGTVTTFNTFTYASVANVFIISANLYYTDLQAQHPVHNYADGLSIERTVKISYNRSNLIRYYQSANIGFSVQPFNFIWAAHPALQEFYLSAMSFVTTLNLDGLTANSCPFLKVLDLTCFASASEWYNHAPVSVFNIPAENLWIGSPGYSSNTTINGTNLHEIANYPIKNYLVNLRLTSMGLTDTLGLPSNWTSTNLPALRLLQISAGNAYTSIPAQVNSLTLLTQLIMSGSTALTAYGNISALKDSLVTLDWQSSTTVYSLGNYPSYFDTFTKLRSISYANCGQSTQSVCTAIVDILYNLVTRNAPLTGANNGTVPYRGMTFNLTVSTGTTAVNGTIQAPTGFVLGSSNGSPANTGEKIYILRNQYGATVLIT